eukprot:s6970_g6.t1
MVDVNFHNCMKGGRRPKQSRFRCTGNLLLPMAANCDGQHANEPYLTYRVGGQWRFTAAEAAEYFRKRHKKDTEIRLNEFTGVMSNLRERFEEVLEDLCEQRTSEGELATEEQRKRDDEEREEYLRNRREEAEHRREGHLRGTTSRTTSPTRRKAGKEVEEEFSDKGPTGEEEEEEEEEEEQGELTEEEKKKLEEEEEQERKRKIREINQKTKARAKEKEKEMEGFEYPHDWSSEWKEYTEEGQIYREHRVTAEKIWLDVDHKYKHQKGQGKGKEKGKEGKEGKGKEKQAKPKEKTHQWKWNANTEYWYWFRGTGKGWAKGNRDKFGMKKCQNQAEMRDKWLEAAKGKGKSEEGKSKAKGSDEVIEIKDDEDATTYQ